jgi:hypothetical protein
VFTTSQPPHVVVAQCGVVQRWYSSPVSHINTHGHPSCGHTTVPLSNFHFPHACIEVLLTILFFYVVEQHTIGRPWQSAHDGAHWCQAFHSCLLHALVLKN